MSKLHGIDSLRWPMGSYGKLRHPYTLQGALKKIKQVIYYSESIQQAYYKSSFPYA